MDNAEMCGDYSKWLQTVIGVVATCSVMWVGYYGWQESYRRWKLLPPGPRGLPVLGCLLSLGTAPHRTLWQLSKRHGPLMFMHLGCMPTLVASSPEMAREILKTHDHIMNFRPQSNNWKVLTYDYLNISFADYSLQHWREVRKYCTSELFGPARISQFEGMRQREVMGVLRSILKKSEGESVVNLREFISMLTQNHITQMMMKKRFFGENVETTTFGQTFKQWAHMIAAVNLADYVPILYPFDLQGINKQSAEVHEKMDEILESIVQERRRKLTPSSSIKKVEDSEEESSQVDFLDLLLTLPPLDESDPIKSNNCIKSILQDLLVAGSDTTAGVMEWILAELLKNPFVMKRVYEELDSVVGHDRLVEDTDIPQLRYLHTVVKETLRLHPPAPLLIPHESRQDCKISGYHIPAGTRVFINVWGIQRDPMVWERPLEFDPDRFQSSPSLDFKGQDFSLFPFGSGRRRCPGMNLSLAFIQFALAQFLHTVTWSLPPNQKPEDLDMSEVFGLTVTRAVPLRVKAKPRLAKDMLYMYSRVDSDFSVSV